MITRVHRHLEVSSPPVGQGRLSELEAWGLFGTKAGLKDMYDYPLCRALSLQKVICKADANSPSRVSTRDPTFWG